MTTTPDRSTIERLPKVLLHDHLDGGLRPQTLIDLAEAAGRALPTTDPDELTQWFAQREPDKDLAAYLSRFAHSVGVMQTRESLVRVARECAEDLAADGVVYAEVRLAPELHVAGDLTLDSVLGAVYEGFHEGVGSSGLDIRIICSAIRSNHAAEEIAELALRWRDGGVVGFDLAGAEDGYPPSQHLDAFAKIREANFHATVHAGEAFGPASIWEGLQLCGGERLGHGVRIVEDIIYDEEGEPLLGRLASFIRDRRIALEMCPSSNVDTGVVASIAEHPIDLLFRLRFRVTVNTDNRLMSNTTLSAEMAAVAEAFGYGIDELHQLTINAAKSTFLPFDERVRLMEDKISPGFTAERSRHLGHSATALDLSSDEPLAPPR